MKKTYSSKLRIPTIFVLLLLFSFTAFAQVGIGTTDPKTTLDVNGALSLREGPAIPLIDGVNDDVILGSPLYSQYRISGPSAPFSIRGFFDIGTNGQLVTLVNTTAHTMTITSTAAGGPKRIVCPSDRDLVLTGINSTVTLQYNTALTKWVVVGYSDLGGYGRNVYNAKGTADANINAKAFDDMADMSVTFTPRHSLVYVSFSASGTMDKPANFDSNAYASFQLRKIEGATSTNLAGTTTLTTDRSNYNAGQVNAFPYIENFDDDGLEYWTQEFVSGGSNWNTWDGAIVGNPSNAHSGDTNLVFSGGDGRVTKIISPFFNIAGLTSPQLTFWHAQAKAPFSGDQRTLKVFYRISETDPWVQLASYTGDIQNWTQRTFNLPNKSSTYQIAFEGTGDNGFLQPGLVVDDVTITGTGGGNGGFLETAWNAGITMFPVSVTPGVETTIKVRWLRDGNYVNVLRNNVATDPNRSHRNLTIVD